METALVISLTGVLVAAFVPTFLAHVRTSKVAEATERLAAMHAHAAAYYARSHGDARACLPPPAGPHPAEPSADRVPVDFASDERGAATWKVLGQSPAELRYSYEVAVPEPGCRARVPRQPAITLRAHGDLDDDGERSLLERAATPSADRSELVPLGPLRIVDRTE